MMERLASSVAPGRRALLSAAGLLALSSRSAAAQAVRGTLRVALSGDLASIDPDWTTATQTRYHAFLVYDTLFGVDAQNRPQPQMVELHEESADGTEHLFTLRPGLRFHDGQEVTSTDVVASWRRWAQRDAAGQMINGFLDSLEAVDARRFRLRLKEPFGGLIPALAKPSAMPLFIKPARIAARPATEQITDATGSGPFRYVPEERIAGVRSVYLRNPEYQPRAEPASGIAGGKVVRIERLEWVVLPDAMSATAALRQGEIDLLEAPPLDLLPSLRRARGVKVDELKPFGTLGTLRLNHLNPPFDNPLARRALHLLVNQQDMFNAVLGEAGGGRVCGALMGCETDPATSSEAGAELLLSPEPMEQRIRRAAAMMREAGYDNRPIIILQPTDQPIQGPASLVMADAMQRAGMTVDLQAMDWASLVQRRVNRDPGPRGWHMFFNLGGSLLAANPAYHIQMSAACGNSWFGWPCDAEMERLRFAWVKETDPAKARLLAEAIQRHGMEISVFIPYGIFPTPSAYREELKGIVSVPETMVFWNISKMT
jgi:peptide/nickel transport system substrate-binding protein